MPEFTNELFIERFLSTFNPPRPYRGESGDNWLVSRVWSDYTRTWLNQNFEWVAEVPAGRGRRLDAVIWYGAATGPVDVALEWEWDNNKSHRDFASGDFLKVLEIPARCGVALLQTRAHTRSGVEKSDATIAQIMAANKQWNRDQRPVFVLEIRRTLHNSSGVEFASRVHDIAGSGVIPGPKFAYSE